MSTKKTTKKLSPALKAWRTRRALATKRSNAALKAWKTRRNVG